MSEQTWLTYREAAERLGISVDGVRMRAKRQNWPTDRGNYPNAPVRVLVPEAEFAVPRAPERVSERAPERPGGRLPRSPGERDRLVGALEAHVETLRAQLLEAAEERRRLLAALDSARADAEQARSDRNLLLGQVGEMAERLDRLHRARNEDADRMSGLNVERAQAEWRAAQLEEELAALRRRWWRRIFGRPDRRIAGRRG